MTTITRAEPNERQPLPLTTEPGRLGNLANLLRKELGHWWGTRMWWVQLLIWVFIINTVTTILALTEAMEGEELVQEVITTFLALTAGITALGIVFTAQDAVIGEKQSGTAAWVMSKPASRPAFILSKLIGYTIGFFVVGLLVPTILFVIMTRLALPGQMDLARFPAALALVALSQLFFISLTLMLGVFFNSRGPVAGIGAGFILVGLTMRGFLPLPVVILTPWLLPDVGAAFTMGQPLPDIWFVPIVATAGWTVLFITLALWRFSREEF